MRALRLSEEAIDRWETLLRYTHRYYQPEYAKFLDPTKENIERVRAEKLQALHKIDQTLEELALAKPNPTQRRTHHTYQLGEGICHPRLLQRPDERTRGTERSQAASFPL